MMRAGGAAKREQLIKAFPDLAISQTVKREYTKAEAKVATGGDLGQGGNLTAAKSKKY